MFQFNGYICSQKMSVLTTLEGSVGKTVAPYLDLDFSFTPESVSFSAAEDFILQLAALEAVFAFNLTLNELKVENLHLFLQKQFQSPNLVRRSSFYQLPYLWHYAPSLEIKPEIWTKTNEISHPLRPRVQAGDVLYSRFCPRIQKRLSFRVASPEKDVEIFTDWQNQPRVANFWELAKPQEELYKYLSEGLQDPHQFPVIYEVNDEAVGYFEFYWAKENRLGPYYDSEAFDRAFHILVGNKKHLGFNNTDAMLKAACHCLFLDEPRTRKIMAEPRHDNVAILKYIETFVAWKKLKEFDFPHKRAALLECRRELFFNGGYL